MHLALRHPLALAGILATGRAHAQEPPQPLPADPDRASGEVLAPVGEYPPELAPPARIEVIQARRLSQSGQPAAAAELLTTLWRELGDPRLLYHAALARGRAGQHTLALRDLRRYLELAGPLSAELRAHIDGKLAEQAAQLVSVRISAHELVGATPQPVQLGPGARISAETPGQPALAISGTSALQLDPGGWLIRVELPGYAPVAVQQRLEPGPGERVWELQLTRRLVALELRLGPPRALRRATLRLTASDRPGLPPIEAPVAGPRTTVRLTTGAWQLAVRAPRHAAELALAVGPDPPPVDLVLHPRPAADARFRKYPKLVIGVAAGMGVSFYTGVGLAVAGANVESKAGKADDAAFMAAGVAEGASPDAAALAAIEADYPTAKFHRSLRRAADLQTAGATIMMTGLGAVLGLLPSLLQSRRRSAYVALGFGGAALIGGAVWMDDYLRRRDALLGPTDPARRASASGLTGHRLGASMLTGLGIGLTLGTSLTLLTDHLRRRKSATARLVPVAAPSHAGLLIHGAF